MLKKIVISILSILVILSTSLTTYANIDGTASEAQPEIEYKPGDVDNNGRIDSTDYLKVKSDFLGKFSLKGTAFAMADVDVDGRITSTDYLKIKSKFLGESEIEDKYSATQDEKNKISTSNISALEFVSGDMEGMFDVSFEETSDDEFAYNPGINYYDDMSVESEKNYVDENGIEHELYLGEYISTIKGTDVQRYFSKDKFTFYFNKDGDSLGYINDNLWLGKYITDNSHKTKITKEDGVSLGTQKIKELFPDMTFVYKKTEVWGINYAYAYTFQRIVNGIGTVEKVIVSYNKYGEYLGYRYFESALSSYDIRTFDVDDNIAVYTSLIFEAISDIMEKYPSYFENFSINLLSYDITISDVEFGVGADGNIAGWADVVISDKETGEAKKTFYDVAFYALSNK